MTGCAQCWPSGSRCPRGPGSSRCRAGGRPRGNETTAAFSRRGPDDAEALDRREGLGRADEERVLVRGDSGKADGGEPVGRDAEPDAARDVRRAGLELPRQLVVRRLLERDGRDHVAAALIRRELLEPRLRSVERADAGRAVHLVSRKRVEVAAERRDVDREVRRALRAVHENRHVARLREAENSSTGLIVPSAFETCETAAIRVRSERRFSNSSTGTSPESVIGTTTSLAPVRPHASCQGTMLEWCSRPVRRISSPAFRTDCANPAAPRG